MTNDARSGANEALVVFRPGTPSDVFAHLTAPYRLISIAPPRIAVVTAGDGVVRLRQRPDVEAVLSSTNDPVPGSLTEAERLFVDGWRQRHEPRVKARPGDGLAWDAPGFLPPDEPGES